jgi:DNA-binding transcriptional MerR regulator
MKRPPRRSDPRRRVSRKASSTAAAAADAGRTFKISEAARLVGVKPYVLRFWETQFPILRPAHTQSKHRVYRERDVEMLKLVKRLLHNERFTIEGAKRRLKELGIDRNSEKPIPANIELKSQRAPEVGAEKRGGEIKQTLVEIRRDLESLHKLLED